MDDWTTLWTILFAVFERGIAIAATLHAVLTKRETQSVIGWVGLIWLTPVVGSLLYFSFGVNRISRRGRLIQREIESSGAWARDFLANTEELELNQVPFRGRLALAIEQITDRPLLPGNSVIPLNGGETAYPEMLSAIAKAQKSITLASYILDNDRAGKEFIEALEVAHRRGVEVRILVDDVGSRYSRPTSVRELRRRGLRVTTFLPTFVPRLAAYANLRNHRKIMVIDGAIGFTGGMNIREGCRGDWEVAHAVQDLHFRIEGPVVTHLQHVFASDWAFCTGEKLFGERWFSQPAHTGGVWSRGISDGPDSDLDNMRLTLLAAIAAAEKRIDIVTPYFLPDDSLVSSLIVATMRGVLVRVLLPEQNNIRLVQWASMDPVQHLLDKGCEIYLSAPPFDHTKLMLVDDKWSLIGSSNWDPRSLRLNFEFNVECYGASLNRQLSALFSTKIAQARKLTQANLRDRNFLTRIRDGLARLAIPYL